MPSSPKQMDDVLHQLVWSGANAPDFYSCCISGGNLQAAVTIHAESTRKFCQFWPICAPDPQFDYVPV